MSNRRKSKSQKKARQNSRLKDHKRSGKILKPPMRTFPGMTSVPWLRDTFPDMLWLCALIKQHGDKEGMLLAAKVLDRIYAVGLPAGHDTDDSSGPVMLTGELTSFDHVPEHLRGEVLQALKADGLYEEAFPWLLVRALSKYDNVPGRWILSGWEGNTQIVGADEPEQLLRSVVEASSHGQSSTATKAKAMILRAYLQAGKISFPPEIGREWADILPRYPDQISEEERRRIEPSIRASFMAFAAGLGEDGEPSRSLKWAMSFWRQNWKLYPCDTSAPGGIPEGVEEASPSDIRDARDAWADRLDSMNERFLETSRASDPDLYLPDRHEVLTGLVYRQLRALSIMVQFPGLWTMEHGSSTIRGVLEARIITRWLILKDDPELYSRFKDYGRGRLKLLKLHLEEYRDSLDEPPADLDRQIEYMDLLVNRDLMEEFQDISIEGNFAGVDTRRMADQVGLLTDYRLVFAPTSANVHGEWAFLDQYILSTCRNPLHRLHRVPNADPALRLGPDVVDVALGMLESLVDDYVEAMPAGER